MLLTRFFVCFQRRWLRIEIIKQGKGYPDIATRVFLRNISFPSNINNFRKIPVLALVDYDPDGLGILATYKHGSFTLAHENAGLVTPYIHWLGMKSCSHARLSSAEGNPYQLLLRLSPRDRQRAKCMLQRPLLAEGGKELEWRRELQVMLMLNKKNEIEVLDNVNSHGLEDFLLKEMRLLDCIK